MADTARLAALIDAENATASATAELMADVLYADNLEGFVIVSSDGDFTRPATRLRESGKTVYGLGRRETPEAFTGTAKVDGWAPLSSVGGYLSTRNPGFDTREHGYAKLGELVRAQPYVIVREVGGPPGPTQLWVSLVRSEVAGR